VNREIVAVLVVPARGDPGGLTTMRGMSADVGGSHPRVIRGDTCPHHGEWSPPPSFRGGDCYMCRYPEEALPLWWDGALVPEGWDRLRRAIPGMADSPSDPAQHGGPAYIVRMIEVYDAAQHGVARVVRLARVDGRLVEVP